MEDNRLRRILITLGMCITVLSLGVCDPFFCAKHAKNQTQTQVNQPSTETNTQEIQITNL